MRLCQDDWPETIEVGIYLSHRTESSFCATAKLTDDSGRTLCVISEAVLLAMRDNR